MVKLLDNFSNKSLHRKSQMMSAYYVSNRAENPTLRRTQFIHQIAFFILFPTMWSVPHQVWYDLALKLTKADSARQTCRIVSKLNVRPFHSVNSPLEAPVTNLLPSGVHCNKQKWPWHAISLHYQHIKFYIYICLIDLPVITNFICCKKRMHVLLTKRACY